MSFKAQHNFVVTSKSFASNKFGTLVELNGEKIFEKGKANYYQYVGIYLNSNGAYVGQATNRRQSLKPFDRQWCNEQDPTFMLVTILEIPKASEGAKLVTKVPVTRTTKILIEEL